MKNTIKLFAIGIMTMLLSFEASLSFSQNKGNGIKKGSVYMGNITRPEQGASGIPAWRFDPLLLAFKENNHVNVISSLILVAIDPYTGGLGEIVHSRVSDPEICSYKVENGLVYIWSEGQTPKDESDYLIVLSTKENMVLDPIKSKSSSLQKMSELFYLCDASKLDEEVMYSAFPKLLSLKDKKSSLERSIELKQIEKERQLELAYQQAEIDYSDTTIYQMVEIMPEFPGGEQKLLQYISKNVKYPQIARESGIKGRVIIGFVIEPNGSVSNVKVLQGSIGGGCDEEAVRVVKSMPRWKPGIQDGKAVRVRLAIPVNFIMQ